MSELKADLLRSRTNPDRPPAVQKADFVKGFALIVHVAQPAILGNATLNVSSLVDTGVGAATLNFTSTFSVSPVASAVSAGLTGVSANNTGSQSFVNNFVTTSNAAIDNYSQLHFCGPLA
ncbi:hypothetical protein [Microvirga sp. Mcv34]|uniref:hypothetical protein n=1 Tax=Microvirga sp. Mcv34 TaxID=2926016 RepID=UPI0021C758BE|nr:hypothetical protein [Microvirga sp. Mcv34]